MEQHIFLFPFSVYLFLPSHPLKLRQYINHNKMFLRPRHIPGHNKKPNFPLNLNYLIPKQPKLLLQINNQLFPLFLLLPLINFPQPFLKLLIIDRPPHRLKIHPNPIIIKHLPIYLNMWHPSSHKCSILPFDSFWVYLLVLVDVLV
jgi:hypothetical protein